MTFGFARTAAAQTCVTTTPIGLGDTGTAIAVQSDGKLVFGGYARVGGNDDFALVRYNPDFSLDLSFGTNGIVTTDFAGAQDRAEAIALQPDGKIVLVGHATNVTRDFALARYNSDGSLDATFGTLGKATSDITGNNDEAEGVAIDASGRIVVAGFAQNATTDYVVARYDTAGNLDTAGFAAPNGYFVSTNGLTNDAATAVAIQPSDGRIVLGGWANNGANDDFSAVRFDVTGAIDPSFGGGPVIIPVGANRDRAFAMTLQSDEKVLLAGAARIGFDAFAVVRLNTNGTLDTAAFNPTGTFGTTPNAPGMVTTAVTGFHDSAFGVVEQTDNKIVVVGWANWDGGVSNVDFALTRYNADGSLDGGFSGGVVTTAVGAGNDWIDSVALQPNGKIVAGGYSSNGSDDDFAVARYNTDGTLDMSCTGACTPLTTSVGAGTITVTASGQFEMTFETSKGGSIGTFYDLAASSTTDLAGGLNPKGLHNFGMRVSSTNYNSTTDAVSASIHLLEATSTRVRVRQLSGYEANNTGALLAGVRGTSTYSVYPAGKTALNHRRVTTVPVMYQNEYSELVAHYTSGVPPLDTWASFFENVGAGVGVGDDDFALHQSEVAGARTDFLQIFSEDWVSGPKHFGAATLTDRTFSVPGDRLNAYWYDAVGGTVPAGGIDIWDSLTYFKPTNFVDHTDPAVTSRSTDYRSPDDISGGDFAAGSRWDEDGNNDGFNESEAAYTFDFDPTNGLTFDMDGSGTTRYVPFMKLRQWRSLGRPTVTLDATPLSDGADFRADVKPFARAHFAQDLLWHSTFENSPAVTSPDVGSTGVVGNGNDFQPARYGRGARINTDGEFFSIAPAGNINTSEGTIEFWYQPNYDFGAGLPADDMGLFGYYIDANNLFQAWYQPNEVACAQNGVKFSIVSSGTLFTTSTGIPGCAPEHWRADEWVHLRFVWDISPQRLEIYINGVLATPAPTGSYPAAVPLDTVFYIGEREPMGALTNNADGIIDEFRIYSTADAPTSLAEGGLQSSADEYLADNGNNRTLSFDGVGASGRGEYFYVGADSEFRGLNVSLALAGVGVAVGDLDWEYWNGNRVDDVGARRFY